MKSVWVVTIALLTLNASAAYAQEEAAARYSNPLDSLAVRHFLGDSGFGERHPEAPVQTEQFGRLAGLWFAEQEYRNREGAWVPGAPAIWVWKYAIGGFAVQDLWYQSVANLPSYLGDYGRDYLLTAMRIFDAGEGTWKVAWMANGAGHGPGDDFGTFTASFDDDRMVMEAPPNEFGLQRIVFSDITANAFLWQSEFSRDGGTTWEAVMRVRAKRQ